MSTSAPAGASREIGCGGMARFAISTCQRGSRTSRSSRIPTRLTNYGGKGTYNLSTNNKLIAYAQAGRKHQPLRQDSFLLGNTVGINVNEDSTWEQLYWGWVWKGEWNAVINDQTFFEVRAGQFGYNWPNHPNGTGPRFEDTGNNIITGGNRDWNRDRRRDQVLGSLSYFKDGWGGDHNFKVGGEIFRETTVDTWIDGYPGDVLHRLNNGVPTDVYLFEPGEGIVGLWTYAGVRQRHVARRQSAVTESRPPLRQVRRLPARAGTPGQPLQCRRDHVPGAGRRIQLESLLAASRRHLRHRRQRQDGAEVELRPVLVEPRRRLPVQRQSQRQRRVEQALRLDRPRPGDDTCHQRQWCLGSWRAGLYGDGMHRAPVATSGGAATESLDPNLEDTYTRELAGWFERELFANFGVRTGFVWRGQRQRYPARQHIPVVRELHRAGHDSGSRTGQRGG